MKKLMAPLAALLLLAGCATLDEIIKLVISEAKVACSVVVDANSLLQALKDLDPNLLNAGNIAAGICRQVIALHQAPPASAASSPKAFVLGSEKLTVVVNGKPVVVTPVK